MFTSLPAVLDLRLASREPDEPLVRGTNRFTFLPTQVVVPDTENAKIAEIEGFRYHGPFCRITFSPCFW